MSDFESFRKQFKGDVVSPSDPGYEEAIDRWAHNAARRAKVVAFVKDPEDVALAIKYAKDAGLRIAIRGGGHSASGASSSENGLVIDLSRYINGVRVDADKKIAYVGGGAVWKTVDNAAIQHGLATVGGTVNHTGVAGLVVGGGYGWLSGRHGLAIDNLAQATVVTADGSILTASDSENPDLFWGIRGGGSNFGVVTEFGLRLHPQRRTVFAGPTIFVPDQIDQLASVLDAWWLAVGENEGIFPVMTRGPDGNPCAVVLLFYSGSEAEAREHFKAFYDLKPVVDMAKEVPYEELNNLQNAIATPGANFYMKGTPLSKKPSDSFNRKTFDCVTQLSSGDLIASLIFEFVPHTKINSVPEDATPYRRDLPGNSLIIIRWTNDAPENSKAAREAAHEISDLMPAGEGYGNYGEDPEGDAPERVGQEPASKNRALFRENYPRLQGIKKKYDPEMIFNKWFAITPV